MTSTDVTRWGFLGAGNIARTALAPAVSRAEGAVLQAVAARDPARAAALDPVRTHATYEALLEDDEVDAVYISLPNDAHLPWAVSALEAGKAVLCEKPLCLTADEVDVLAEASRRTGVLAVEASWYRWHPRVRLAQARLGEVGRVLHVRGGFTYPTVAEGDFRLDPGKGGGALYDIGCYAVSACLWAVGRGVPDEVAAQSQYADTGVDLDTRLILTWEGGPGDAAAEVHASMTSPEAQWLVVTGERGEVELPDRPYSAWRGQDTVLAVSDGRGTERVPVPATDAYQVMVEEVSSVLRGGPGWVLPLAESRETAAVLDAARASAAAGGEPVRPSRG